MNHRKVHRLKPECYSQNGAFFITVCARDRRCIFSDIVGALHEAPVILLKPYGQIVENVICQLPQKYDVKIDHYVIMPNHIHLLLSIDRPYENGSIRESTLQRRSDISKIIGYLKMNVTKEIHRFAPAEKVFQRSFYDHIVRGQHDYEEIRDYIDNNPAKWLQDRFYSQFE